MLKPLEDFFLKKIKISSFQNELNVLLHSKQRNQALKNIFIILLSGILLLPSFGNFFVYTNFKLNQEEIIKTICVQRKQVFNTCNGRCELQKSLKKYADNEKKMENNLKEKSEIVYIQNTITAPYSLIVPIKTKTQNFSVLDQKPVSVSNTSFRPPSYFI